MRNNNLARYIVRLFGWCRKYGIRVYLDLHTIPGSQNGRLTSSILFPRSQSFYRLQPLREEGSDQFPSRCDGYGKRSAGVELYSSHHAVHLSAGMAERRRHVRRHERGYSTNHWAR